MRKAITVGFSLPADLAEKLLKICEELGVSRSLLIQQLLRSYFAQREQAGQK